MGDPMFLLICGMFLGFVLLVGFALHPSSETTSISQRLEGLRASQAQQQRGTTSLRDQEEMQKSAFTRVILPLVDRMSRMFGAMMPNSSLERGRKTIAQAGMTGKVTPTQIMTLSYILMFVVPLMSLSFTGIPTGILSYQSAILFIAFILGYRLPYGYIQGKAQARQHEIRKALPFTLDLISISVEAGMALDGAMAIVQEKSTGPMAMNSA